MEDCYRKQLYKSISYPENIPKIHTFYQNYAPIVLAPKI